MQPDGHRNKFSEMRRTMSGRIVHFALEGGDQPLRGALFGGFISGDRIQEKQIGIMQSRVDDMVFRMEQMKGASADAWQEIARGTDEARKTMHGAFEKARVRFKDL